MSLKNRLKEGEILFLTLFLMLQLVVASVQDTALNCIDAVSARTECAGKRARQGRGKGTSQYGIRSALGKEGLPIERC